MGWPSVPEGEGGVKDRNGECAVKMCEILSLPDSGAEPRVGLPHIPLPGMDMCSRGSLVYLCYLQGPEISAGNLRNPSCCQILHKLVLSSYPVQFIFASVCFCKQGQGTINPAMKSSGHVPAFCPGLCAVPWNMLGLCFKNSLGLLCFPFWSDLLCLCYLILSLWVPFSPSSSPDLPGLEQGLGLGKA